jgi:hypothetical protein
VSGEQRRGETARESDGGGLGEREKKRERQSERGRRRDAQSRERAPGLDKQSRRWGRLWWCGCARLGRSSSLETRPAAGQSPLQLHAARYPATTAGACVAVLCAGPARPVHRRQRRGRCSWAGAGDAVVSERAVGEGDAEHAVAAVAAVADGWPAALVAAAGDRRL